MSVGLTTSQHLLSYDNIFLGRRNQKFGATFPLVNFGRSHGRKNRSQGSQAVNFGRIATTTLKNGSERLFQRVFWLWPSPST